MPRGSSTTFRTPPSRHSAVSCAAAAFSLHGLRGWRRGALSQRRQRCLLPLHRLWLAVRGPPLSLSLLPTTTGATGLDAARERCFGPAIVRVAETITYCRLPIHAFHRYRRRHRLAARCAGNAATRGDRSLPRGRAVSAPQPHRTANANYIAGALADTNRVFDAGVCIEVNEHLTPPTLRNLAAQLAAVSRPGSLYLFNSGQPDFVEREDPGYLDPHGRAHRVLFAGRCRQHLPSRRLQHDRVARPHLGLPRLVWRDPTGRWPRADHPALAPRPRECIHVACGAVR